LRCLCKLGFEGASLSELADAAKVNKGLMVHYFGTKERLFLALLEYVHAVDVEFTNAFMNQEREYPDGIERYIRANFSLYSEHPFNYGFTVMAIQRAQYDSTFRKRIDEMFDSGRKRIAALLRERHPEIRREIEISTAATQIHTDLVGSVILSVMGGGKNIADYERRCLQTSMLIAQSLER
jgi:AcrR family transcriptional regulator